MFCQVSGERGRRLQGSHQGGPQCPEESTEAEKTQDLPAAVTLGAESPSGTVTARDPGPASITALHWHLGLDSQNILEQPPLGSGCGSLVNEGARPTHVPLPQDWHLFQATGGPLSQLLFAPSHACLSLSKPNSCLKRRTAPRIMGKTRICNAVHEHLKPTHCFCHGLPELLR